MPTPNEILKQYWGYNTFKDGQLSIIESIIQGKDTLAILPTGGGKSLCYQIPALLMPGKCIVVTPLIALMKDQVINLLRKNIPALALHSGMSSFEIDYTLQKFHYGDTKFIFVSPERLLTDKFLDYLQEWHVGLLVIDEAHCISQWGYDFRPAYLKINECKTYLHNTPTLALTASATKIVQADIETKLNFTASNIIAKTIARKNISIHIRSVENKINETVKILNSIKGTAIVYCKNRGTTVQVTETLLQHQIQAVAYHGGMQMQERNTKQEQWINDKARVVVCTNAFGMGIDKPDVKCVIHYDAPENLEAYYQEAGRAGRDGNKSFAVLLQRKNEWNNIAERIEQKFPSIAYIKYVYQCIGNELRLPYENGQDDFFEFDVIQFCKNNNLQTIPTINAIKILEQQEYIKLTEGYYIPSRIMCIANREQMDYIESYHANIDKVLKAILRLYAGILHNYINVQEIKIAQIAEIDIQLIKPYLLQLESLGIIQYTPFKDKPQIQFIQERLRDYDMHLDAQQIQFLSVRYAEQLQSMQQFCETTNKCRMQILSNYFGETKNETCNICDSCINENKKQIEENIFNKIESKIEKIIKNNEEIMIQELMNQFEKKEQTDVNTILHYYLLENKIIINKNGEIAWR
jgi:ATP-dependent DNA helicase RecQ